MFDSQLGNVLRNLQVAIKFVCDRQELDVRVSENEANLLPLYKIVYRQSYLPLLLDDIKEHFGVYFENTNDVWFSVDNKYLRWHVPIGVLYDIERSITYREKSRDSDLFNQSTLQGDSTQYELWNDTLWEITVHFKNFPFSHLINFNREGEFDNFFMSMLKEADYLRHKSSTINSILDSDKRQLLNFLRENQFDKYYSKQLDLLAPPIKHLPYKIYTLDHENIYIQTLVELADEIGPTNNEETSTNKNNDNLSNDLPNITNIDSTSDDCLKPAAKDLTKVETLQDIVDSLRNRLIHAGYDDTDNRKLLCHGLFLDSNISLKWAACNLVYPDNFMHLVLVV